MSSGVETFVKVAPAVWPGKALEVQPGNLSLFAPMGNGLGAPPVMMPWDNLESVFSRQAYYSFHPHTGHPFTGSPVTEPAGGVVYFDDDCSRGDFDALLRLMGVWSNLKEYAAFVQDAEKPQEERYLTQMRVMAAGPLRFLFGVPDGPETAALTQQQLPLGEVLWRFLEHYRREAAADRYPVRGALGGDGDWAKESLAFGFMVENAYHGIYRIWTRAWLVTK